MDTMKWLNTFLFCLTMTSTGLMAGESGSLLLRAVVIPKISLNLEKTRKEENRSIISLIAKSNSYNFENHHQVEIENPLGLDLEFEEFFMDGRSSQREYRFTVRNNIAAQIKNPFFTVKISAN